MSLIIPIQPIIDPLVLALCVKPYPLHPKGCPNVGKCDRCPPIAPMFDHAFNLAKPVYAVVNEFDLGSYITRMKEKHPDWSDRQLYCVLYWQGTARKQLKEKIKVALVELPGYTDTWCPEGMGVNVTETMAAVGIFMEWPPKLIARQIAFLALPRS